MVALHQNKPLVLHQNKPLGSYSVDISSKKSFIGLVPSTFLGGQRTHHHLRDRGVEVVEVVKARTVDLEEKVVASLVKRSSLIGVLGQMYHTCTCCYLINTSVTRWLDRLLSIWPFGNIKWSNIIFCQSGFKVLNIASKILPKL